MVVSVAGNSKQPSAEPLLAGSGGSKELLQSGTGEARDSCGIDRGGLWQGGEVLCAEGKHQAAQVHELAVDGTAQAGVQGPQQHLWSHPRATDMDGPAALPIGNPAPAALTHGLPAAKVRRMSIDQSPKAGAAMSAQPTFGPSQPLQEVIAGGACPHGIEPLEEHDMIAHAQAWIVSASPSPGPSKRCADAADIVPASGFELSQQQAQAACMSPPRPREPRQQQQQRQPSGAMYHVPSGAVPLPALAAFESYPAAPATEAMLCERSSRQLSTAASGPGGAAAHQQPQSLADAAVAAGMGGPAKPVGAGGIMSQASVSWQACVQPFGGIRPVVTSEPQMQMQVQHSAAATCAPTGATSQAGMPSTGLLAEQRSASVPAAAFAAMQPTACVAPQPTCSTHSGSFPPPLYAPLQRAQSMYSTAPVGADHPFEMHPLPPWAAAYPQGYGLPPMPGRQRLYRT